MKLLNGNWLKQYKRLTIRLNNNYFYSPIINTEATQIHQIAEQVPDKGKLQMLVTGENIDGNTVQKTILLPLGIQGAGQERLSLAGLEVRIEDGKVIADNIVFGSAAQKAGFTPGVLVQWPIHEHDPSQQQMSLYSHQ